MTLEEIARTLGFTRELLQSEGGYGRAANRMAAEHRRQFMVRAFEAGHDIYAISAYLSRKMFTVRHGLRMHCMENYGQPYSQSESDLRKFMGAGA